MDRILTAGRRDQVAGITLAGIESTLRTLLASRNEQYKQKKRFSDGLLTYIPSPFGSHLTISCYDGENIYTLQTTGGHIGQALMTKLAVDSPFEVKEFKGSATECPKLEDVMDAFLDWMPYNVAAAVVRILVPDLKYPLREGSRYEF